MRPRRLGDRVFDAVTSPFGIIIGFVLFFAALLGLGVLMADLVYGDWHCAFAECRILKEGR